MKAPETLSVVLPNYNHAKYIGRALTALLAQGRAADEIIVIDDGSNDASLRIIDQFSAAAPTIRVLVNSTNRGVIATLERGLQAATGKYLYFAAADDFVLPGFFDLAIRRLEADPQLGLFCGEGVLVDDRTNRPFAVRPAVRPLLRPGRISATEAELLLHWSDNWILTGSTIFRRDCVLWAGGFDERLGSFADGFLARKIALRFGFFFEPKPVASWVIFRDSVSRTTALDLQRAQQVLRVVPALISADPGFPTWYAAAFRDRWRFATCRLALQAKPVKRELLLTMATSTKEEYAKLDKFLMLPAQPIGRLIILAWLWYRLRPTTLAGLFRTMMMMRLARQVLGFRFGRFRGTSSMNSLSING
jgi:glycosyltransferase involved in cell wall biosynthesis